MTLGRSLSEVLDECLQRVLKDGESIEACVAHYPEYADELRDELEMALAFRGALAFTPDVDKKRDARLRMNDAIARRASKRFSFSFPWPRGLFATGTRIAAAAAVGVLALVGTGTGTVYASHDSAPGDVLYVVKRTSEDVQLAFALSDEREADLLDTYVERRVVELDVVTAAGREQFVPDLVDDIIRKSNRSQRLVTAPVRQVVDTLPDVSDDGEQPAVSEDVTPQPGPSSRPAPGDKKVSARRLLALNEELAQIDLRLEAIQSALVQPTSVDEVKRLRQALNQTNKQLERLMDLADQVQGSTSDQRVRPQQDADDPGAPIVRPTPERPEAARPVGSAGRVQGEVRDVVLRQQDGKLVRVDVEVILEDGDLVIVVIERGGAARLLKDGEAAGLRQLRVGQQVVLGVAADGEVQALSIVTPTRAGAREGEASRK